MALIVPDISEPFLLAMIKNELNFGGMTLKLYKNNYTPVDASLLANFTEADFSGYAAASPVMGIPVEVANKAVMQDTSSRTFTHNGGGTSNTVYGYFVLSNPGPDLVWAERFPAGITMAANGDQISIQLQFTLNSENH